VSSLLDQVGAKVVRAKRALRQSRRIIVAARDELESHERWLDRHRAAWAEAVKCHHRLLNLKMAIRASTRLAFGLIQAAPFALAQTLRLPLKEKPSRASSQLNFAETAPHRTQLQHRIRGLDGQLCTLEPAGLRPTPAQIEMRRECSPTRDGAAFHALASLGGFSRGTILISALGFIILLLIAAGAVRATISSPPAEAPVLVAPKVAAPAQHAAAISVTVPKVPIKTERSAPVSGFAVLAETSASEPVLLPAQTIADMMSITSPLALASMEPETSSAPIAEEPPTTKPAVKAKAKRKLVRREPQPLPWWQRERGRRQPNRRPDQGAQRLLSFSIYALQNARSGWG